MEDHSIPRSERTTFRLPGIPSLRIPLQVPRPKTMFSSALFLIYSFAGIILAGTILLILPVSSRSGGFTSPVDALFTATSAVSVTGLVVLDTGDYWNMFGQGVILALFQIGGIGFVTGATLILLGTGHGLGLREKLLISDAIGIDRLGGLAGIVVRVTIFSILVEGIGATVFYLYWSGSGAEAPLWRAVFHAVSAFNNSGMDIFGRFRSLADYQGDAVVLLTTAALIITGSTGYLVVEDVVRTRSFTRLCLESKLVLAVSFTLVAAGTLFYLAAESSNPATLGPLEFPQKLLVAFFQAVSPRTAGFAAIDIGGLRGVSLFFTMFLMFAGGAAGSVAGGVKVNTIGILGMTALSALKGNERVNGFGREITQQNVYRAVSLVLCYLGVIGLVVIALSLTEAFHVDRLLFETFSALGTVGFTTGITPDLTIGGRLIVIVAMFAGRLGPLTFVTFLAHRQQPAHTGYPHETIRIA
ncbi:MAG: Trk family potassium uptake protein [Chloroflexi bacterium]|nr:Trk family potassium uptake protein [Chloroflexota bacterium]